MSQLKSRRNQSSAEFVNTACKIHTETLGFLSRLSARYSRLLATDTIHLADLVEDHTEQANSMLPTDETRYKTRLHHLLEARAALMALDKKLSKVYQVLMMNPEGAFAKDTEKKDAIRRIDNMADSIGGMIDAENEMLRKLMDSDRERFKKAQRKKH